jgi:POLO box duplicated region
MQTRQAIMFRLSNKIVQVLFSDKTEILLNSQDKIVSFMNKRGERSHYPLADAMASNNTDMTKRLRYTKDILVHLLRTNNTGSKNPTQADQHAPDLALEERAANTNENNHNNNVGNPDPNHNQFGITSSTENDFPRLNSNMGGSES